MTHHIKGNVCRTCVQSVLTGLKLRPFSLERAEHRVRWMCGVGGLKAQCGFVVFQVLTGCDRLRWFGHLECKSVDDWVSACRKVELAGCDVWAEAERLWENA